MGRILPRFATRIDEGEQVHASSTVRAATDHRIPVRRLKRNEMAIGIFFICTPAAMAQNCGGHASRLVHGLYKRIRNLMKKLLIVTALLLLSARRVRLQGV